MFDELHNGAAAAWLLVLLALWVALLFGGFIFSTPKAASEHRMPTWTRMASSLTLVLAGWSWCVFTGDDRLAGYAALLASGMTLGCVGDLALARLLPVREPVLAGMAAFGLGHVAYIAALLRFRGTHAPAVAGPWLGVLLAWLVVGLAGWYIVVARGRRRTVQHWVALPYALLLACSAGLATGLALQSGAFVPVALGGALFLTSDLILAGQLFGGLRFPHIGDVIWLTYGPAQALIIYGANAAIAGLLGR